MTEPTPPTLREAHQPEPAARSTVRRRKRFPVGILALVAVLVLAGVGLGWAGRTLLLPPQEEHTARTYAIATTNEGSLGRTLKMAVAAQWQSASRLVAKRAGTLTSIDSGRSGRIGAGDVLYTVDLSPVYVLPGTVPAFRDLAKDVEGEDVAQLQAYLFDYWGWGLIPDGKFGNATERALKAWQKDQDLEETGMIPLGQVLFTPELPVGFAWEDEVQVGSEIQAGTALVKVYGSSPSFSMKIADTQLGAIREGLTLTLNHDGHQWPARIGTITKDEETSELIAEILPPEGSASICAPDCHLIPAQGMRGIEASIVVIPEATGTVVPINALRVDAGGQPVIVREDGAQVPVQVLTTVGGQAVVDGIEADARVRVWGESGTSGSGGAPAETPAGGQGSAGTPDDAGTSGGNGDPGTGGSEGSAPQSTHS